MRIKLLNTIIGVVLLSMMSCSSNESQSLIEYVPYQEEEFGKWGMIAPDGTILFKDKFEAEATPTLAYNGRFLAKNENELWEIYTAEKDPKKVGGEYRYVTSFEYGVALAVENGRPITLIDRNGKVLKELDKLYGQTVDKMFQFIDGTACFETDNGKFGAIDTKGNVIIKPDYCVLEFMGEGKFFAVEYEYKENYLKKDNKNFKFTVIDKDKGVLFTCNRATYNNISLYHHGVAAVSVLNDGMEEWGFIDDKGEWMLKPSSEFKAFEMHASKKFFAYCNDNGWGILDLDHKERVRAKYYSLTFADQDRLMWIEKEHGDNKVCLMDVDEKEINGNEYEKVTKFDWFEGQNTAFVLTSSKWEIIDKSGKCLENLPNIKNLSLKKSSDKCIEGDNPDFDKIIPKLLHYEGQNNFEVYGHEFYHSAKDIIESGTVPNTEWASPYKYIGRREFVQNINECYAHMTVVFPKEISSNGYIFNDISPDYFCLEFPGYWGKLNGNLGNLYAAFNKYLSKSGAPIKSNKNAAVYHLGFGKTIFIHNTGTFVRLYIGYKEELNKYGLGENADISYFESIKEHFFGPDMLIHSLEQNEEIITDEGPTE